MTIFVFDHSGDAYNACQYREDIKKGDCIVIPEEQVVGLAGAWPTAITIECGNLHSFRDEYTALDVINDAVATPDKLAAAIREARRLGFALTTAFDLVVCESADGWSLHAPGATLDMMKD